MCFICVNQHYHQEGQAGHIHQQSALGGESGSLSVKTSAFTSSTYYVDALLEGFSWTGTTGSSATVTYSFTNPSSGSAIDLASQAGVLQAMQAWSSVANINFSENFNGSLTFSSEDLGFTTLGLATTFFSGTTISSSLVQVDDRYTGDFSAGTEAYGVLIHEIGHALGLKHPGNYGPSESGPFLPDAEENKEASVMSYNNTARSSLTNVALTPMIYDIAAIQYLYGANTNHNATATGYAFDGSQQTLTIWDGGGNDVISAASYTAGNGTTIDLREGLGNVTTIGQAYVWIAFGANIESAEGSSGNDTIFGNSLGNKLFGREGVDTIRGGDGDDVVHGGLSPADPTDAADELYGDGGSDLMYGNGGNDIMFGGISGADPTDAADTMFGGGGSDQLFGNGGNDSMFGGGAGFDPNDSADTLYGGAGSDTIFGNGGDDSIFGGGSGVDPNDAADIIYGGAGNDSILANGGNDIIYGNEGNDTMQAGVGNDAYAFYDANGVDTILLFDNPGVVAGDTIQIFSNINGTGITSASDVLARITYSGGNAIIDMGGGNSVTVANIADGAFTADDFAIL